MENLRHLRALQAFDATATQSSLSKAADVLGVTHGAVSRQIKILEEHLGVGLFVRRPNGVELTDAGKRLHQSTQQGFSALQLGVQDVRRLNRRQSIKVSLPTAVALKWLVPHLPDFHKSHPGIALFLDTDDAVTDFDGSEVDVALRYATSVSDDLYYEKFSDEELIVVAAPALIEGADLPMSAAQIAGLPLLHDSFNTGWDEWAVQQGLSPEAVSARGVRYADSAVVLEAAIDRQGVALARRILAERDLALGRLVRLDESRLPLERSLYFVCRKGEQ
ncbi:MAG: LysR substrate-binding domain-containing protein, partial [Pikeienuella sp.]